MIKGAQLVDARCILVGVLIIAIVNGVCIGIEVISVQRVCVGV